MFVIRVIQTTPLVSPSILCISISFFVVASKALWELFQLILNPENSHKALELRCTGFPPSLKLSLLRKTSQSTMIVQPEFAGM